MVPTVAIYCILQLDRCPSLYEMLPNYKKSIKKGFCKQNGGWLLLSDRASYFVKCGQYINIIFSLTYNANKLCVYIYNNYC